MENDTLLYISNILSLVLFTISEVLGMSTCKYNGVFEFALGGCFCKRRIYGDNDRADAV